MRPIHCILFSFLCIGNAYAQTAIPQDLLNKAKVAGISEVQIQQELDKQEVTVKSCFVNVLPATV